MLEVMVDEFVSPDLQMWIPGIREAFLGWIPASSGTTNGWHFGKTCQIYDSLHSCQEIDLCHKLSQNGHFVSKFPHQHCHLATQFSCPHDVVVGNPRWPRIRAWFWNPVGSWPVPYVYLNIVDTAKSRSETLDHLPRHKIGAGQTRQYLNWSVF